MLPPQLISTRPRNRTGVYESTLARLRPATHQAVVHLSMQQGVPIADVIGRAIAAYAAMLDTSSSNSTDPHLLDKDGLSGGKTRKSRAIDGLPPKSRERR